MHRHKQAIERIKSGKTNNNTNQDKNKALVTKKDTYKLTNPFHKG